MKRAHWILSILFLSKLSLAASALAPVPATSLFVARGFDDNDEVVATLDGYLPSACYQLADAQVTADLARHRIYVQQMAYVSTGFCAQVISPYFNTVRLGRIPAGNYTLMTRDGKLNKTLVVTRAPVPTKDDYLYAPVDSAFAAPYQGSYVAVLTGRFTNTCLRMRAIPVTVTGDTVQVMPIMELRKQDDAGRPCKKAEIPFHVSQKFPALSPGRYLLHVRSLNGRSLNSVFSVE